ncbi:hypothetical protein GW920_02520 [Candidatus Falkowbacteria bacterium]|uniref:Uncharacterized protein n=1 Tax=Candidatus Falkowbacteria bacterium CG10_big_fil_rev_8_21_14_0_10_37_18 TaxID=1974562 RepID=A0A2H0V9A8_9BACT|nr:hypothetical protein [Candidatus Falkowbacteria bacterium]NCQ12492.1 hypothetical protein [Candidatus Falkowbacteria bacterium]OIO06077.1 MAG: hypothetical protein AUJ26_01580 [Candidatus Falkowbacteria bacterium CG1_02_37_21]PIR95687.1 MAG: hypothetical protein COT93_00980 [Candidatus Falkowbacteria bacterium CG10_big_fil_rev_8_21_14_0_10_37_18]
MVSPNLTKRAGEINPVELNDDAKKLFQVIHSEKLKSDVRDEDVPYLRVSTLISRLAFVYEKVRNAIDYDEDHLLRKNAILRILRRQVVIESVIREADSSGIASHLLTELIRGGYLPNNALPESLVGEVAVRLEKYIYLKNQIASAINADLGLKTEADKAKALVTKKNDLVHWLLTLAACEIEEHLAPNPVKQRIVDNLFSILSKLIKLPPELPYSEDREIQIYLSISRTFLKFDSDMLSFILFKYYNDAWLDLNVSGDPTTSNKIAAGLEQIKEIASNFNDLKNQVDDQLNHELTKQLDKIVRAYSLYFSILAEALENDPAKIYRELQTGDKSFIALIRKVCNQKYNKAKRRLWRAAVRSIIYIFLTKSVFVFIVEVPAIHWLGEPLNYLSLAINASFPAVLLFLIVILTRKPKENNTDKIVEGIKEITFKGSERTKSIMLRRPKRRNWLKSLIFNLIYVAAFYVSVYYIVKVLTAIDFTWVSIIIFLFFLAFVSFFSILTTRGVKDLIVVEKKENIVTFFLDLFYMPIIMAGRWLSTNFSKINVFIFFFDFIVEAPFKVLVEVAEDWTKYVKERRENLE